MTPLGLDSLDVDASRSELSSPNFRPSSDGMDRLFASVVGVLRSEFVVAVWEERRDKGGAGIGRFDRGVDIGSDEEEEGVGRR